MLWRRPFSSSAPFPSSSIAAAALVSATTAASVSVVYWWIRRRREREEEEQLLDVVELACACDRVRIAVRSVSAAVHLVCYCDDCQGYIDWLLLQQQQQHQRDDDDDERGGGCCRSDFAAQRIRAARDRRGGSRTCQVLRSQVTVCRGPDLLQVTVLDPDMAVPRPQQMMRAHCRSCYTPLFSACWREFSVLGLYASNVIVKDDNSDDNRDVDDDRRTFLSPDTQSGCWSDAPVKLDSGMAIPPPRYRINTQWARTAPDGGKPDGHGGFPFFFLLRFLVRNLMSSSWSLLTIPRPVVPCPVPLPAQGDEPVRYETRHGS